MSLHPVTRLVLNVLDPLHFIRSLVLIPATLFGFYNPRAHERHIDAATGDADDDPPASRGNAQSPTAKEIALKTTFVAFAAALIIWASIFMYITFYYTYMPAIEHIRPVHIQFDACNHDPVVAADCEFPHAFVPLTRRQNLLMLGQSYKVYLHLEMPETQRNREMGMFMVCADLRDEATDLLDHACRSVMLHYKSSLVRAIRTWLLSPLYVFDIQQETQHIEVELFSDYGEDQSRPVRDVFVEIQSRHVQLYSVSLHIVAHFTGLRYIMFHWPFVSAAVGICTNLFFILVVSALSWYHWGDAVWFEKRMKLRLASTHRRLKAMTRKSNAGNRSVEQMLADDSRTGDTVDDELGTDDDDELDDEDEYASDPNEPSSDHHRVSDDDDIVNVSAMGEVDSGRASNKVRMRKRMPDGESMPNDTHK